MNKEISLETKRTIEKYFKEKGITKEFLQEIDSKRCKLPNRKLNLVIKSWEKGEQHEWDLQRFNKKSWASNRLHKMQTWICLLEQ